jgi:hypothetical protein
MKIMLKNLRIFLVEKNMQLLNSLILSMCLCAPSYLIICAAQKREASST